MVCRLYLFILCFRKLTTKISCNSGSLLFGKIFCYKKCYNILFTNEFKNYVIIIVCKIRALLMKRKREITCTFLVSSFGLVGRAAKKTKRLQAYHMTSFTTSPWSSMCYNILFANEFENYGIIVVKLGIY